MRRLSIFTGVRANQHPLSFPGARTKGGSSDPSPADRSMSSGRVFFFTLPVAQSIRLVQCQVAFTFGGCRAARYSFFNVEFRCTTAARVSFESLAKVKLLPRWHAHKTVKKNGGMRVHIIHHPRIHAWKLVSVGANSRNLPLRPK